MKILKTIFGEDIAPISNEQIALEKDGQTKLERIKKEVLAEDNILAQYRVAESRWREIQCDVQCTMHYERASKLEMPAFNWLSDFMSINKQEYYKAQLQYQIAKWAYESKQREKEDTEFRDSLKGKDTNELLIELSLSVKKLNEEFVALKQKKD